LTAAEPAFVWAALAGFGEDGPCCELAGELCALAGAAGRKLRSKRNQGRHEEAQIQKPLLRTAREGENERVRGGRFLRLAIKSPEDTGDSLYWRL